MAALSGLLGASLLAMTINLSHGEINTEHQPLLIKAQTRLGRLRSRLEELVDLDAAAFAAVVAAHRLPQGSAAERSARRDAIHAAAGPAAEVPLTTARACLEVLEIGQTLLGRINAEAAGDLLVGALTSHAGLLSALLNVAVNLPLLEDADRIDILQGQLTLLRSAGDSLIACIQASIGGERPFDALCRA